MNTTMLKTDVRFDDPDGLNDLNFLNVLNPY
jgi:hypothetical protein